MSYHTSQRFSANASVMFCYRYDVDSVGADFTDYIRTVNVFCTAERVFSFRAPAIAVDSSRAQFRAAYRIDCHKLAARHGFPISKGFHYFSRDTERCVYMTTDIL